MAFVLVDSFAGLKKGIMTALLFAFAELIYTLIIFKTIDGITASSFLFVVIFGVLSYRTKKAIYFKLQPVFLGLVFGLTLIVMYFFDKPLLVMLMNKYQYAMPAEYKEMVSTPIFKNLMQKLSYILGWGFLIHAGLVAYAAYRLSNYWWLAIRGIGVYIMMFLCTFIARFY